MFKRYIDDLFFLLDGSVEELELFICEFNQYHSHIKFIANYNLETKEVPFLDMDMNVSIDDNGFIHRSTYKRYC